MTTATFRKLLCATMTVPFALSACSYFIRPVEDTPVDSTTSVALSTKPEASSHFTQPAPTVTEEAINEPDADEDDFKSITLEEKVYQMILVSCHSKVDIADAVKKGVGGLCLYAFSFEDKTAEEVKEMTAYYQSLSKLPLIISTDEEGGTVNRVSLNERLRAVPFWSPADLYSYGGWELVKSDTVEKSQLLLSLGINVNLAPVCDVPLSEDNYIFSRTFSMSHQSTGEYIALVVSQMKENGIGSVLKHFPGYGGSVDTHENVAYDYREYSDFLNGDFIPFIKGIEGGADSVLVSHNIVTCMDDEMPASLSPRVHEILRNDLNFDGVIMTDDLVMDAITEFTNGENAAVYAVLAGNDMLCCEDYDEAASSIVNAVKSGIIDEAVIDASVKRIINWKESLGLLQ